MAVPVVVPRRGVSRRYSNGRSVGWSVGRSVPKRRRARSKFRTRELCEAWLGSRFSGGAGACSRVVLCVWSVHRTELSGGREACLKCYPKCHCKHCCGAYPPTRGASRTVIGESRTGLVFWRRREEEAKKKTSTQKIKSKISFSIFYLLSSFRAVYLLVLFELFGLL